MNGKDRNIDRKKEWQRESNPWADKDMLVSSGDSILFGKISDYMRAEVDIEEVNNDPQLKVVNGFAREIVTGSGPDGQKRNTDRNFIIESLADDVEEKRTYEEINDIKLESSQKGIDKVASGWVSEWNAKSQNDIAGNGKSREIKEFITGSLKEQVSRPKRKKVSLLTWMLTSAAALTGALIVIRSLFSADDPDRLFTKYYQPMEAISPVTRSANAGESGNYFSALEYYKNRDYQAAAAGFSLAAEQGIQANSARFFLGISHMALENYKQAVSILEGVVKNQGEYLKEATWYLGLAYIKTGEPLKADVCFETLAGSPGFYSDRAEKILRRLK